MAFAGSFEEHFECYRARYDYREMIERLAEVFGDANIVVRPYEKGQFFGGTIFADFMHHVFGSEDVDGLVIPEKDQNSRLDHDALEFKRLINGLDGSKDEKLEIGRHLVKYCARVDPRVKEAFQAEELLSPRRRLKLLEAFVEGNAWIARRYLRRPDGDLFLELWPSGEDAWTPYSGLTATKAAELAFHLYQSMANEKREREAKRHKAERRERPKGDRPERGEHRKGFGRAVRRFWKHRLLLSRALVGRLRLRSKPKPGLPG